MKESWSPIIAQWSMYQKGLVTGPWGGVYVAKLVLIFTLSGNTLCALEGSRLFGITFIVGDFFNLNVQVKWILEN